MAEVPLPSNETQRLIALRDYGIVGTLPEQDFDDLTFLAAQLCGTPIALLSFIEESRQWLKSHRGLEQTEMPRHLSFCNYTISGDEPLFVIPDMTQDARFADHPFVTDAPGLRFYAGTPLKTEDDLAIGTLCVIDSEPRDLTAEQGHALQALARQAVTQLELRRSLHLQKQLLEERERIARELRDRQRRFDEFMDHSPVLAFIKDARGRMIYVNETLAKQFSTTRENWLGKDDFALWSPDIARTLRQTDLEVLSGNCAREVLERMPSPDGTTREFLSVKFPIEDANGEFTMGGLSLDITERLALENALRQSEERYRDLVENASDLVQSMALDGHVLYVNEAWLRTMGYTLEEAKTLTLRDFVHPRDLERCLQIRHRVLESGHEEMLQATLQTRHRRDIEIEGCLNARFVDGVAVATSGIFRDVTERRKVERMKNEFIATVSHELRTPLTSIRGALGLLEGGAVGELPERAHRMVEIAHKNSERLMRLINDLLDVEKIESGHLTLRLEPLSLPTKIRHTLETNRAYGETFGVQFHFEAPQGEAARAIVRADTDRLSQVMANLLSNAAKFSPRGATVNVSLQPMKDSWRVLVQDNGSGIPEEFRAHIFQKFAQADASDTRQKSGTGLGLSISRALIEGMGGRLDFVSQHGQGSTFFFDLPRWKLAAAHTTSLLATNPKDSS